MVKEYLRKAKDAVTRSTSSSGSSSGSASGTTDEDGTVEPAASPPVKDVSPDPGTSGEDIESMATGDRLRAEDGRTTGNSGGSSTNSTGSTGTDSTGDAGGSSGSSSPDDLASPGGATDADTARGEDVSRPSDGDRGSSPPSDDSSPPEDLAGPGGMTDADTARGEDVSRPSDGDNVGGSPGESEPRERSASKLEEQEPDVPKVIDNSHEDPTDPETRERIKEFANKIEEKYPGLDRGDYKIELSGQYVRFGGLTEEGAKEQFADQLQKDNPDITASDVNVEETSDGFEFAGLSLDAQKELARKQVQEETGAKDAEVFVEDGEVFARPVFGEQPDSVDPEGDGQGPLLTSGDSGELPSQESMLEAAVTRGTDLSADDVDVSRWSPEDDSDLTAEDIQDFHEQPYSVTVDESAQQSAADGAARVTSAGQLGEELLEQEIEDANPGVDVDVGRSADGDFAVDVVDTPSSSRPALGQLGEDLSAKQAERTARAKVGEQVDEEFPNANLVPGEHFTTSVDRKNGEVFVSAELTDAGRKEIAKENAPLQDTPLEGVTEWGAGVNFDYEEFRRGLHDGYEDTVRGVADHTFSPLNVPVDYEGNEYEKGEKQYDEFRESNRKIIGKNQYDEFRKSNRESINEWWNENTPDVPDIDIDGPSAEQVLGASAVATAAPEPVSSGSGVVVGGATLAALGVLSLSQDPAETNTGAELPVSDPTQQQEELSPEEFNGSVTEIEVGDGEVTEVEPGETIVQEIGIPEDTETDPRVLKVGEVDTGTDTGTGPSNPFAPGVGPDTPSIEDVEDPEVTEEDNVAVDRDGTGVVTEGEVSNENGDDILTDVEEPEVTDSDEFVHERDAPGVVSEGEVGSRVTDDSINSPEVTEDAISSELLDEANSSPFAEPGAGPEPFGVSGGLGNVGTGSLADANVHALAGANATAAADANVGLQANALGQPNAFAELTSFGANFGNPTAQEYGYDMPFNYEYGFDFGGTRKRFRWGDEDSGLGTPDGDRGFGVAVGSDEESVAPNWFNETVATTATGGTETFNPAGSSDMFGLTAVDVSDEETREKIDEGFEFFKG